MRVLIPTFMASLVAAGGIAYADTYEGEPPKKDEKYVITPVGEPQNCVRRSNIRSTDVVDDSTIDFKMRGGDIYRNTLPNKCSGLAFEEAFSYRTSTNRLCKVDIIRVLDSTAGRIEERNACGLGQFQKIEKTKRLSAKVK